MSWLDDYFARIEYRGSTDVSLDTLHGLHEAHVFKIPFENLDIHMGRPIKLDQQALIDKLIYERRGGYCYEMNGLFSLVLETLGFRLDRLFARIMFGANGIRPRSHQLSLVYLGQERYLADVGYGTRSLIAPLCFEEGYAEQQYSEYFRVVRHDEHTFALRGLVQGEWQNFYSFTLERYLSVDYIPVNYYTSTSPDSHFTQRRMITMPTTTGRLEMTNEVLKISVGDDVQQVSAENLDEYLALLHNYFGIRLELGEITYPVPAPVGQ